MLTLQDEVQNRRLRVTRGKPRPDVNVSQAYLVKLRDDGRLMERDETLCKLLVECPVLSTDQVYRALWPDNRMPRGAQRRLRQLYDMHIIDRVNVPYSKMREADLAPGMVHTLGKGGRLWMKLLGYRDVTRSSTNAMQASQFIVHDLWVSEMMVLFLESMRIRARISSNKLFLAAWSGEDAARAVVKAKKGSKVTRRVLLEPDALVKLQYPPLPGQERDFGYTYYFVEWDSGVERGDSIDVKLERYERYARREEEWKKKYPVFPRALMFTVSRRRADNLLEKILDTARPRETVWLVSDLETLKASASYNTRGITGEIWRVVYEGKLVEGEQRLIPFE